MKINPDCVRDLLLDIEETTSFKKYYTCGRAVSSSLTNKYEYEVVLYHARYCYEAKLINGFTPYDAGDYFDVADLSPAGHSFLANIRSNTNWKKVKDICVKIGSFSLEILTSVAAKVAGDGLSMQIFN